MESVQPPVRTSDTKSADEQARSSLPQPTCKGTTKAGPACRSRAVLPSGYCYAHDPANVPMLSEVARRAGIASGVARRELGKSPRKLLAERLEANIELVWGAFEDGLRSDDERVRLVAATSALAEAYGKPAVTIVGESERPVAFQIVSAFAAGEALEAGDE